MADTLQSFLPWFVLMALANFVAEVWATELSPVVNGDLTMAAVAGIVIAVCGILLLIGCASLCPRKPEFKSFGVEDMFPDMEFPSAPTSDFSMIPPTEDTALPPDQERVTIHFEPLPDLAARLQERSRAAAAATQASTTSNTAQVRPKVLQVGHERRDSEEEGGDEWVEATMTRRDSGAGDKVRLERVLSSSNTMCTRDRLQYIREMGSGWFGKVLHAEGQAILPGHKKTQVVLQMLRENASEQEQYAFLLESSLYRDVDHANVLKVIGHCCETVPYLTVLELCANFDLKSYLRSQRSNVEQLDKRGLLLNFACDIAAGLQAMHQSNYVHRDLALRNCLLTQDLTVKVGDYGLSEELYKEDYYRDANGDCLPIRWLAPEVISFSGTAVALRQINKDSNLWSFGIALWELISLGSTPYGDLSDEQVLRLVICERSVKLFRPELPVSNLDRLYQLMVLCWSAPFQRPSLRELRILLLHLRSHSGAPPDDIDDFERKWNKLMPRHAAHPGGDVGGGLGGVGGAEDIMFHPSSMSTPSGPIRGQGKGEFEVHLEMRPTSLETELGAAMLSPSLSHPLVSLTNPQSVDDLYRSGHHVIAANEMSLEEELSAVFGGGRLELGIPRDEEKFEEEGEPSGGKGYLNQSFAWDGSAEEDDDMDVDKGVEYNPGVTVSESVASCAEPEQQLLVDTQQGDDARDTSAAAAAAVAEMSIECEDAMVPHITRTRSMEETGMLERHDDTDPKLQTSTNSSDDSETNETKQRLKTSANSSDGSESSEPKQSPSSEQDDWSIIHAHEYASGGAVVARETSDNVSAHSFTHLTSEYVHEDFVSEDSVTAMDASGLEGSPENEVGDLTSRLEQ